MNETIIICCERGLRSRSRTPLRSLEELETNYHTLAHTQTNRSNFWFTRHTIHQNRHDGLANHAAECKLSCTVIVSLFP
ncbi:hypothetical protein CEXT_281091 [Caerostris extrusa]|uniref:Uncharacterized protein n=1 Tax=Caerostris extrusa TaxID=172846 RepID=A0AAV4QCW7_CAEEX|nr:hypothetical protein CEXT_281091 [Caerostris extrusa]